ncbi:phosphonate ABC transporter ATP-binding protein [Oerskovia sp. NPDC057915]|uniref:phosphonate ABC transporter ATP-binding protein n=1 Tax=Oerskovia sp. NPDC057915 TaxID=3346280 RepID=UPI0036DE95CC
MASHHGALAPGSPGLPDGPGGPAGPGAAEGVLHLPDGVRSPGLHVRDLRVQFSTRSEAGDAVLRSAVDGMDLDVAAGELVAILGANGCGKSTTLKSVIGLAPVTSGEVWVGGEQVHPHHRTSAAEQHEARRRVAMIFQQVNLVRRRTVLDNVCAGALGRLPLRQSLVASLFPRELRAEAMLCLERVGLADRALDRVGQLSGGQQQRVAVARALCQRASVLLADEPTSALDPAASTQVMELLATLAHDEGLAVVAVLHDPELAREHADRLVGMVAGRERLNGAPDAVTRDAVEHLYSAETATVTVTRTTVGTRIPA